jgi:hypothetical protein
LLLSKQDGKHRHGQLTLSYLDNNTTCPFGDGNCEPVTRTLEVPITSVKNIGCGSKEYVAQLHAQDPVNGARISIVLRDHSNRLCHDLPANLWQADVREGFGWCGTMDSTMALEGFAQPIYTIQ